MKLLKRIVLIFLTIILIFVLYSKFIKKDPIIKIFKTACFIVATGSMEPAIMSGEFIVILQQKSYELGDIVTFIDEEGFVITHRIVEKNGDTFISKGDSNNIKDESCNINMIQGKVVFHSKILGFFVLYLLKPICIFYAAIVFLLEVIKNLKEGEKANEIKT